MDQEDKKISVIVPNYNYCEYLEDRIFSIVKQTFPVYEIIILDDCSTDDSVKTINNIIKKIHKDYPKINIKTKYNSENSGNVFKQWQAGIKISTGNYIWIAEVDDVANRNFLKQTMKAFADKDIILSYSNTRMIKTDGRIALKRSLSQKYMQVKSGVWKSYVKDGKKELLDRMSIYNSIPNVSAVIFKKNKHIDLIKILDEAKKFKLAGDWYFYSQILCFGKISFCNITLNGQRIHNESVTGSIKKKEYLQEVKKMHNIINDVIGENKAIQKKQRRYEHYLCKRFGL